MNSYDVKVLSDERLGRETQSNGESMRPLWFFHLYIPSSATTALSTLCQGRLYFHIGSSVLTTELKM